MKDWDPEQVMDRNGVTIKERRAIEQAEEQFKKRWRYHQIHDSTDGYDGGPAPYDIIEMATDNRLRRAQLLTITALSAEASLASESRRAT